MNNVELETVRAEIFKRIGEKKRLAPTLVKRYFDLAEPVKNERDDDSVSRELIRLYGLYAKALSWNLLCESKYIFKEVREDGTYSMENWLDELFDEIIDSKINTTNRKEFVRYAGGSLVRYMLPLKAKLSYYRMCIALGYVCSTLGIISTKDKVNITNSSYRSYQEYLFRTVSSMWPKSTVLH